MFKIKQRTEKLHADKTQELKLLFSLTIIQLYPFKLKTNKSSINQFCGVLWIHIFIMVEWGIMKNKQCFEKKMTFSKLNQWFIANRAQKQMSEIGHYQQAVLTKLTSVSYFNRIEDFFKIFVSE